MVLPRLEVVLVGDDSASRLSDLLKATGAVPTDDVKLLVHAVDGYSPTITIADARKNRFSVATHLDD
jgi:hypothetical protein